MRLHEIHATWTDNCGNKSRSIPVSMVDCDDPLKESVMHYGTLLYDIPMPGGEVQ